MPTPSAKAALTSNTGHRRSRTVATLPPATPTRASGQVGGQTVTEKCGTSVVRERCGFFIHSEGQVSEPDHENNRLRVPRLRMPEHSHLQLCSWPPDRLYAVV